MSVTERLQEAIDAVERFGAVAKFLVVPNSFEKEYLRCVQDHSVLVVNAVRASFNGLPMYASELAEKIHVF